MAPALTTLTSTPSESPSLEKIKSNIHPIAPSPTPRVSRILHRTTTQPPLAVNSSGITYTLSTGQTVIDGVGGAAVACIGNGNTEVLNAMDEQGRKIAFVYGQQLCNEPAEDLAELLINTSDGAFELCGFVSGGSEAVESAIKLARQYWWELKQPQRSNFIARRLSFHGNSLGTLALAHHPVRRVLYEDCLNHVSFHHVSPAFPARFQKEGESTEEYVERLRKELEDKFEELGGDTVAAFVAETVVGATSGVVAPPPGYFKAMKSVCDKYGALLLLDEVMSGMGRMGTLHAWQTFGDGVTPDIQTIAKGLGGGYASIGGVLMNKRVADGIRDNSGLWLHSHTYQGHPISCAAALAVQRIILRDNLLANSRAQGVYLSSLLHSRLRAPNAPSAPYIFDIRGAGSFWGIDFDFVALERAGFKAAGKAWASRVQACCLKNGLLILAFSGTAHIDGKEGEVCILAPPYNVTKEEVEQIVELFVRSVEECLKERDLIA